MYSADLAFVYGAALRAASDEDSAAGAALDALDAPGGGRRELMARAVASALERSPCEPLDLLPPDERQAIGLARIVGMDVDEIAEFSGCQAREVKSRLVAGLARLSGGLPAAGAV